MNDSNTPAAVGDPGALRRIYREARSLLVNTISGFFKHDGIMMASTIAFSLVFAVFPFVVFLVTVGAIIGGPEIADYLREEFFHVLPDSLLERIEPELERVLEGRGSGRLLTFSLFVILFSVTGAIETMRDGLNRAYGCADNRNFFQRRLQSLFMFFIGIFFLVAVTILAVAVPIWMSQVASKVTEMTWWFQAIDWGRKILLALVLTLMLTGIHLFLPARHRDIRVVASGVAATLVLWWIAGQVFGFYLSNMANYSAIYAGLGGIIAFMLFLNIVAVIFQVGAELNRSVAERMFAESLCSE